MQGQESKVSYYSRNIKHFHLLTVFLFLIITKQNNMKPSKFFSNIIAFISIGAFVVSIVSITTFVETATEFNTNCIDCTPLSSKEEMYLKVSKYNLIFSIIGLFTALFIRTNSKSTD